MTNLLPIWAIYGHVGGGRWNAFNGTSLAHLQAEGIPVPRFWWVRASDGSALMSKSAADRIAASAPRADPGDYKVQVFDPREGGLMVRLGLPGLDA